VIAAMLARLQRLPLPVVRRRRNGRGRKRGGVALRCVRLLARPRVLVALVALVAALGGGWLWFRDSSLVAVKRIRITGLNGPDSHRIAAALRSAARNMTTLDVNSGSLYTAVAPYAVVKSLMVTTQFPHGMRIRVIEQIPVGAVTVGDRSVAVAADGTLLHDVPAGQSLATIPLQVPPVGSRVSDPRALAAVEVLGAAPYELLAHVAQVSTVAQHGLVAQLRNGPSIYFGDGGRLHDKWIAATKVLADAGSKGATYIDVTDPARPAAGAPAGGSGSSTTTSASATTTASSTSTTTPGG
jgi:cell division protein FtsQ